MSKCIEVQFPSPKVLPAIDHQRYRITPYFLVVYWALKLRSRSRASSARAKQSRLEVRDVSSSRNLDFGVSQDAKRWLSEQSLAKENHPENFFRSFRSSVVAQRRFDIHRKQLQSRRAWLTELESHILMYVDIRVPAVQGLLTRFLMLLEGQQPLRFDSFEQLFTSIPSDVVSIPDIQFLLLTFAPFFEVTDIDFHELLESRRVSCVLVQK
jgi:hypothetical protein